MDRLYDYISYLPSSSRASNHDVKYIHARELVSRLRAPGNLERDMSLVPDTDIKLIFSTDGTQPSQIRQKIDVTEGAGMFSEKSLLGLCLNGRGPDPEIFINDAAIQRKDPSGALFDEIMWHEYIHAVEGMENGPLGPIREMPWSYTLQQLMLQSDRNDRHVFESNSRCQRFRKYQNYLREGTAVQQNVSEIFARIGALFLNNIQKTGYAPTSTDIQFFHPDDHEMNFQTEDRTIYNLSDLTLALSTYGENARHIFRRFLPEAIERITTLYGCRPRQTAT